MRAREASKRNPIVDLVGQIIGDSEPHLYSAGDNSGDDPTDINSILKKNLGDIFSNRRAAEEGKRPDRYDIGLGQEVYNPPKDYISDIERYDEQRQNLPKEHSVELAPFTVEDNPSRILEKPKSKKYGFESQPTDNTEAPTYTPPKEEAPTEKGLSVQKAIDEALELGKQTWAEFQDVLPYAMPTGTPVGVQMLTDERNYLRDDKLVENPIARLGEIGISLANLTALPFTTADYLLRNTPSPFNVNNIVSKAAGTFFHMIGQIGGDVYTIANELNVGLGLDKVLQDATGMDDEKWAETHEKVKQLMETLAPFLVLGKTHPIISKVAKEVSMFDFNGKAKYIIDQAKNVEILTVLEAEKKTAQENFNNAKTPEERVKALKTIEEVDKKSNEYQTKLNTAVEKAAVLTDPYRKEALSNLMNETKDGVITTEMIDAEAQRIKTAEPDKYSPPKEEATDVKEKSKSEAEAVLNEVLPEPKKSVKLKRKNAKVQTEMGVQALEKEKTIKEPTKEKKPVKTDLKEKLKKSTEEVPPVKLDNNKWVVTEPDGTLAKFESKADAQAWHDKLYSETKKAPAPKEKVPEKKVEKDWVSNPPKDPYGRASEEAVKKAVQQIDNNFPTEFLGFQPPKKKGTFTLSAEITRDGKKILNDYTFSEKTGKLLKSENIEQKSSSNSTIERLKAEAKAELEQARKDLKSKINRPNMTFGLDTLPELYKIGKYHALNIPKYVDWAKQMIKEVGMKIKPHLKTLWEKVKTVATTPIVEPGTLGAFGGQFKLQKPELSKKKGKEVPFVKETHGAPFKTQGTKRDLLGDQRFKAIIDEAIKDADVIDVFGGSGIISKYAEKNGAKSVTTNFIEPKAKVSKYLGKGDFPEQVKKAVININRAYHSKMGMEYIKNYIRKLPEEVGLYIANNLSLKDREVKTITDYSKSATIQPFERRLKEFTLSEKYLGSSTHMKDIVERAKYEFKPKVISKDGWELIKEAKPGQTLIIDPPYHNVDTKINKRVYRDNVPKVKDLVDATNKGVKIVYFDAFDKALIKELRDNGIEVEVFKRKRSPITEIIANNFKKVAEVLKDFATGKRSIGDPNTMGLFGGQLYGKGFKKAKEEGRVFQNPKDKKYRYEIDDSKMELKLDGLELIKDRKKAVNLVGFLEHDKLFKDYPTLRGDVRVQVDDWGAKNRAAMWRSKQGHYVVSLDTEAVKTILENPKGSFVGEVKKSIIHELQHVLQMKEDFTVGSSILEVGRSSSNPAVKALAEKIRDIGIKRNAILDKLDKTEGRVEGRLGSLDRQLWLKEYKKLSDQYHELTLELLPDTIKDYKNISGEYESRDSANRLNLTESQRDPHSSEYVPPYTSEPRKMKDTVMAEELESFEPSLSESTPMQRIDPAVTNDLKRGVGALARMRNSIKSLVSPVSMGKDAEVTARLIVEKLAIQERDRLVAEKVFKELSEMFSKNSDFDNQRIIHAIEKPDQAHFLNSSEEAFAKMMRKLTDAEWATAKKYDKGLGYIKNYFPHIWERKSLQAYREGIRKKNLSGAQTFRREREIETVADGIEHGLVPVTMNPVDLTLLKLSEMRKFNTAHQIIAELKDLGLVKTMTELHPPLGWEKINDKIGEVKQFSEKEKGMVYRGSLIMPENAARIINNYLSPGLHGYDAYDVIRAMGNTMNQVQLGLSAFHAAFTSIDANVSKFSNGLMQISRGEFKKGLKSMAESPGAFVTNYQRGKKLYADYLRDIPMNPALVQAIQRAGGRINMDSHYINNLSETVSKSWKKGGAYGKLKAGIQSPFALVEQLSKPILGHLVPRQKLGVFSDMATDILDMESKGKLTKTEATKRLQEAWRSVDNRMGQLVYDNLFWDRRFKDVLLGSVRSVGWNLGTYRELGGGLYDIKKVFTEKRLTPRLAYTVSLPIISALAGAVYGYLNQAVTGDNTAPESTKDLFFPRTGKKAKDGTDERLSFPTYTKDVFAYANAPLTTLGHKLHPFITAGLRMYNNADYYGVEISDAPPGTPEWFKDQGIYIAKQFVPYSIGGAQRLKDQGQTLGKQLQSFFGLTEAPGYIRRNSLQNKIQKEFEKRFSGNVISQDEKELMDLRKELNDLYEAGRTDPEKMDEYQQKSTQALLEKKLSKRQIFNIEKEDIPSDIKLFSKLSNTKKEELWNEMSEEEKARYSEGVTGELREKLGLPARKKTKSGKTTSSPPPKEAPFVPESFFNKSN